MEKTSPSYASPGLASEHRFVHHSRKMNGQMGPFASSKHGGKFLKWQEKKRAECASHLFHLSLMHLSRLFHPTVINSRLGYMMNGVKKKKPQNPCPPSTNLVGKNLEMDLSHCVLIWFNCNKILLKTIFMKCYSIIMNRINKNSTF